MSSRVSVTTLSELSDDLQKKICELESLSCKSEKILTFINLCKLENDPQYEQDNEVAFRLHTNVEPDKLVRDRDNNSPKVSAAVEGAYCTTANSLEDVLSMARAIRSKGVGQILLSHSVVNEKEKSVTKPERRQVNKTRTPSAPSSGRNLPETKKVNIAVKSSINKEKMSKDKKSDCGEGVMNDRYPGMGSRNEIDDFITEKGLRIREHLFAQLDILKRSKRILTQCPSDGIDKELYCAHEMLLTKLNSRKTFPRSVAYSALKLEKKKSNSSKKGPVPLTPREKFLSGREYFQDEEVKSENLIEILITALIEGKEYYDRILKGKLNRIPLSKIGKEDLKDIFRTWYKTQKNLEFYESFQGEKNSDENNADADADIPTNKKSPSKKDVHSNNETNEINKLREFKLQTLDLLSCDFDMISSTYTVSDETVTSQEWLTNTLLENRNYHDEIDLRARYIVEVSIGRNELKAAMKRLKECCEMEKDGKEKNHNFQDLEMNQRKWIFALKHYKAVYSCLAVAAQNATSCMFIPNNETQ